MEEEEGEEWVLVEGQEGGRMEQEEESLTPTQSKELLYEQFCPGQQLAPASV